MNTHKWILGGLAVTIMVITAGFLAHLRGHQRLGAPGVRTVLIPGSQRLNIPLPDWVAEYSSTNAEPTAIELEMLPQDTSFGRRYYFAPDQTWFQLGVVLMGTDRTSIHKPEFCLEAQGWHIKERQTAILAMSQPHPYLLPVRKFITSRTTSHTGGGNETWSGIYVFWFVSENRVTASHWERINSITWDLLSKGILPRWAYISCFAPCRPGNEEATFHRVERFLANAVPEFQLFTPEPQLAKPVSRAQPAFLPGCGFAGIGF